MNIATYFTLLRIALAPLFLVVYTRYEWLGLSFFSFAYFLLFLWFIAEFSDLCDGYFARKYNQVTEFGKILDPMADSIYRLSVFFTFTLPPVNIPLIFILIFLYRDSCIATLRTACALQGIALGARLSGKIKAVLQGITCFVIIILLILYTHHVIEDKLLNLLSTLCIAIVAIYTLISGAEYLYVHRLLLAQFLKKNANV